MNNVLSTDKNENNFNKQVLSNNFMSEQRLKNGKEEFNIKKTFTNLCNIPFNLQKIVEAKKENSPFKNNTNSLIIKKDSMNSYNSIIIQKKRKNLSF